MQQIIKRLLHPGHALAGLVRKRWYWFPDDEKYLKLIYFLEMGHRLNLKHPKRFTEKLQWLKLYDRKPEYTRMVDKITAKEYVAEIIGQQYIIPTLGVWEHFDDIDFDQLPDKFVLKTNHGSGGGGVVICRDKNVFDFAAAKTRLEGGLRGNTYNRYREWPYKNIEPKIFAEALLEDKTVGTEALNDYKFYCFDGEPQIVMYSAGRFNGNLTFDYYDMQWNKLPLEWDKPNSTAVAPRPDNMEERIRICRALAKGKPHVRVDLYHVDGKEYFGELTFFDASGFSHFKPEEWNRRLGDLITLPTKKVGGVILVKIVSGEVVVEEAAADLTDYKFFCFNGTPRYCQVIKDRHTQETIDFFDMDWQHQEFIGLNPEASNAASIPERPKHYTEMQQVVTQLAKGKPFSRIDLYAINDKVYFGEITLYPASGFGRFAPDQYDEMLGQMLTLPGVKWGGVKISLTDSDIRDYKFFCFNGVAKVFKIDLNRFHGHRANYYSRSGELLDFGEADFMPDSRAEVNLPQNLPQMLVLADKLSSNHIFLRVDFYSIGSHIYFGELTFYPASGLGRFTSDKWDKALGEMLRLKNNS